MNRYCLILICCLPWTLVSASDYTRMGWQGRVDLSTTHEQNISHAWITDHVESDTINSISVGGGYSQLVGQSGLLQLNGYLRYQGFREYDDMNTRSLSLGANYLFRISEQYHATTYGIGLQTIHSRFDNSDIRDGETLNFSLTANKRLTRSLNGNLGYLYSKRNSEDETFDTTQQFLYGGIDSAIAERWVLYAEAKYMQGDLLLHAFGAPNTVPGSADAAKQVNDLAFARNGNISTRFRFSGEAVYATIGLNYQLTGSISMDAFWQHYRWETNSGINQDDRSIQLGLIWSL